MSSVPCHCCVTRYCWCVINIYGYDNRLRNLRMQSPHLMTTCLGKLYDSNLLKVLMWITRLYLTEKRKKEKKRLFYAFGTSVDLVLGIILLNDTSSFKTIAFRIAFALSDFIYWTVVSFRRQQKQKFSKDVTDCLTVLNDNKMVNLVQF